MRKLAAVFLLVGATLAAQERIAVLPAEPMVGSNVRDQLAEAFGGQSPATVLADYMASYLSEKPGYVLVDRRALDATLGEQANPFLDGFAYEASVKLRSLALAEYLATGRVAQFSVTSNILEIPKLFPQQAPMARVSLDVNIALVGRVIQVAAGDTVTADASGKHRESKIVLLRDAARAKADVSKVAHEAMKMAARALVDNLLAKADPLRNVSRNRCVLPAPVPPPCICKPQEVVAPVVAPVVAAVAGDRVVIIGGEKADFQVGERLEVLRPGEEMSTVEVITVVDVQREIAVAETVGKAASQAKPHDLVRPAPTPATTAQVVRPRANR